MGEGRDRSSKAAGDNFEREVVLHYEALGFSVQPNTMVDNYQIDLLASKYISGAGHYRVMIEAKYRGDKLGIHDIPKFLTTAERLMQTGSIQAAVMVTSAQISKYAAGAPRASSAIRIITIEQLRKDLFNFTESLLRIKIDYESSSIFRDYIPLRATLTDPRTTLPDVADYVFKWGSSTGQPAIILVGDFGSGKSTVLQRAFYEHAKRCLEDPRGRYPILLKLGKLLHFPNLWTFIASSLREDQHITPTKNIFDAHVKAGKFTFYLDGFDEIHTSATAEERARYLSRLAPLLSSMSPCVISTRPTYFESLGEMSRLFDEMLPRPRAPAIVTRKKINLRSVHESLGLEASTGLGGRHLENTITLEQLRDEDVLSYLQGFEEGIRRRTGLSPKEAQARIYKIYDLKDLTSRPLLLNMLVVTIIEGGANILDGAASWGPAAIYAHYMDLCVKRDYQRWGGMQVFEPDERLAIARQLALAMHAKRSLVLVESEIVTALRKANVAYIETASPDDLHEHIERSLTDIRVCTFLKLGENVGLSFAHKSYMEFFVAQACLLDLEDGKTLRSDLATRGLTAEIMAFLGSFAFEDDQARRALLRNPIGADEEDDEASLSFSRRIIFAAGMMLNRVTWERGRLRQVALVARTITNFRLDAVELNAVRLQDVFAREWAIRRCPIHDFNIQSSKFFGSALLLSGTGVRIEDSSFSECQLDLGGQWRLTGCTVESSEVALQGKGVINAVRLARCQAVALRPGLSLGGAGSLLIEQSTVFGSEPGWHGDAVEITFSQCTLVGVRVGYSDLDALVRSQDPKRSGRLRFINCHGFVLVDQVHDLPAKLARSLWHLQPKLQFVAIGQLVEQQRELESRDWSLASGSPRDTFSSLFKILDGVRTLGEPLKSDKLLSALLRAADKAQIAWNAANART